MERVGRPWHKAWPSNVPKEVLVEPRPLHSLLTEASKRFGGKACVRYQGRTITYSELADLSSRFAAGIAKLGLEKGDRVALFTPNIPQFVIGYFGTLMAGGIVVPCSPLYKERELELQLNDSGARMAVAANDVVGGNDLFASLEGCRGRLKLEHVIAASVTDYLPGYKRPLARFAKVRNVRRRDTIPFVDLVRRSGPIERPLAVDPTDVAVLQYTGGTTGTSKGAALTHLNLLSATGMAQAAISLTERDVTLAVLPLFHIFGMIACMTLPILSGGETVLLPRFEVEEVMGTIQKEKVTFFPGVPTMYVAINNHPAAAKFELSTVRVAFSGGAALPGAVRKRFNELTHGNLVEGYGLTETSAVGATNPIEGGLPKEGSIGTPFPSTDARVVATDDRTKVLGVGEIGELALKGPQVMKGYWRNEAETDAVLLDGWLLTGDIARMDEDGYFYIVDRKKDMISVGGLKVYPREVEEVLFAHPLVREAAVVGVPDPYMGESVKACVVLKDPAKAAGAEEEILAWCRERLAKYKVPRTVMIMPELPKTLVGKVLRRKLREEAATS